MKYSWYPDHKIVERVGEVTYTVADKEGNILPGNYHASILYKIEDKCLKLFFRRGGRCSVPHTRFGEK